MTTFDTGTRFMGCRILIEVPEDRSDDTSRRHLELMWNHAVSEEFFWKKGLPVPDGIFGKPFLPELNPPAASNE